MSGNKERAQVPTKIGSLLIALTSCAADHKIVLLIIIVVLEILLMEGRVAAVVAASAIRVAVAVVGTTVISFDTLKLLESMERKIGNLVDDGERNACRAYIQWLAGNKDEQSST